MPIRIAFALVVVCFAAYPAPAAPPAKPIPVILDLDIGTDIDDAFALGLVLASPELELRGVTTVGVDADDRAWLACRFLTQCRVPPVPVAAGKPPQPDTTVNEQIQYRRHPAAIFNRTMKPVKQSAVELMHELVSANPGEITLIAVGPLTNVARLLKEHPESAKQLKRVVIMGGSVRLGYQSKPPVDIEWNIRLDPPAARALLNSGVPVVMAPLDATASVKLTKDYRDTLFGAHKPMTWQLENLYELWGQETPTLFDPVAVVSVFDESFCKFEDLRIEVDDKGLMREVEGKPNARVAVSVDVPKFLDWIVGRLSKPGEPTLPRPPGNPSKLIDAGAFPKHVHVAEDYDNDIERRWWMSGKAEMKDLRPGGRRACRAVLTQDFDDLQGDVKTMYRAVVFNPVPGPPMGPNTRLAFRYKLHGADTIRVQLYSLSNGYHRYLSISGLPQDEWKTGAVDMTAMRRPDGTGGPLSADERIDDIQFYIDPRAELLIDDVVLYDAAAPDEKRPFPKRILFTGWFDTGKQGGEWPGTFEILPHEKPKTWKFARSVSRETADGRWIRLSLRGDRRLGAVNDLLFKYRLSAADDFEVALYRGGKPLPEATQKVKAGQRDIWSETTLRFAAPEAAKSDQFVDEIRFLVPADGVLDLDDLLLYEPGVDVASKH